MTDKKETKTEEKKPSPVLSTDDKFEYIIMLLEDPEKAKKQAEDLRSANEKIAKAIEISESKYYGELKKPGELELYKVIKGMQEILND